MTIEFEHANVTKSIGICSNIEFVEKEYKNFWCSGSEPICKMIDNGQMSLRICHKSIRERDTSYYNSYLTQHTDFNINDYLELRFADERKKYIHIPTFSIFGLYDNIKSDSRESAYGFIQTLRDKNILVYNHMIVNSEEFIELEFNVEGKEITEEYMKDEIEYIITQMKGMPMHNKG